MKFYFISDLVIFVAVTIQQRFFFFFPCVLCFYHGVLWRELCKFVWNEKSYSSLSLSLSLSIYIYIYIYIYFKYKNRDTLLESVPFLKRGRLHVNAPFLKRGRFLAIKYPLS
jgi:hypothetical protein